MMVDEQHYVDASEPDAQGQYEYYYAYTELTFVDEARGTELRFRFYDASDDVYLLTLSQGVEIVAMYDGEQEHQTFSSPLLPIARHQRFPRELRLFRRACQHLIDAKRLVHLKVFNAAPHGEPFSTFRLADFADADQ